MKEETKQPLRPITAKTTSNLTKQASTPSIQKEEKKKETFSNSQEEGKKVKQAFKMP